MERSIVAVEANHPRSSSINTASNSLGSLVKIESITVDLGIAMEKDAGKCQHFSIRGYVAEMRKKDRKICSPFSLDGNHNMLEEQLPPLSVAKFRWWRCQNCLQEIGAASASDEIGAVSKCCKSEIISNSICSHIPSHGDAAVVPSDLQQPSKLEIFEGMKADANISANLNGDKNYLTSCSYKKEKNAEGGQTAVNGHENGLEHDANQKIDNLTWDATEFDPYRIQESLTVGTAAIKSRGSVSVNICEQNRRSHDAADILPTIEYPKCKGSNPAVICSGEKINSSDQEQRNVLMAGETSREVGKIDVVINPVTGPAIRLPSLEVEECDNDLSENDEILAGDDHHNQNHDNSSGLPRRKTQKVRLLTELLGGKGNAENDQRRTECDSCNAIPNLSAGLASLSDLQGEVALHESIGNAFRGPQRKRKMPQDQDWKPPEISCMNNVAKKIGAFKGTLEKTIMPLEISDSVSEEDTSPGVGLQSGVKRKWSKNAIDRNPIPDKMKNKQTQVVDGYSPSLPWQEVMSKINHIKIGEADKCGASAESAHDAFRGRGMEQYFKNYTCQQQIGKKSMLSKKKSKMAQVEDGQVSLIPNSLFVEHSIKRKGVKFLQSESEIVKPQSEHIEFAKIGLDLSLNSYLAEQRNEKYRISQVVDKIDPWLPQRKGIPSTDLRMNGGMHVGESSVSRTSASNPRLREELLSGLSEVTAQKTAIRCQQKNCSPQPEDGSFSLLQKLDFSGPCNDEKTVEAQGLSEFTGIHSDQRDGKVCEQRTSDDIPMEIVELMAKNQYERGLYESERSYYRSKSTNDKRNAESMGFPKVHENGVIRSLQKKTCVRKPPSTKATNGRNPTGENVVPTKRNPVNFSPVDRNHFIMGQQKENPAFTMFGAHSESQGGVQVSASGTFKKPPCRDWSSDIPLFIQLLEVYNSCYVGSQQNERARHVWSSVKPNHLPSGLGIPQKCSTQSSNVEMRSQCPELHKGKMIGDLDLNRFDLNTVNLEKQNKNFESFKRSSAEYPNTKNMGIEHNPKGVKSLDSYSNETIPAMQLLSLMDAGMKSSTPFSVDAKRFVEKPFSPCENHPSFSMDAIPNSLEKPLFPHHYHSKEFSGLGPGLYKASGSSRRPSSAYHGKNHPPEKSCECLPAVPAVDPFVSLFHNDGNFKRAAGFTGQVFVKSQEQEKAKRSYSPAQNRGHRSQEFVFTSGVSHTCRDSNLGQDKQQGILGASETLMFPLERHTVEDSTKCIDLESCCIRGTVRPMESMSKSEACCLNRNPADFSIPEAGNEYMISGEDLRFGKKIRSRSKFATVNVDRRKPQRVMKRMGMKEHAPHQYQ